MSHDDEAAEADAEAEVGPHRVEILRVVTYNTETVSAIEDTTGSRNVISQSTSRYLRFLSVVCIGSTIAIPAVLIFIFGLVIDIKSLWEMALYVLLSCALSLLIVHCYRYETFELYFRHKSIEKRIMCNGWSSTLERWLIQNEDANMDSIKKFKRVPYVLPIANRIDRNVLWFVRRTNSSLHSPDKSSSDNEAL